MSKAQSTSKKTVKKATTKKKTSNAGRKLFDGKDKNKILAQLENAFSIGSTDEQACIQADISVDQLYRYEQKNLEFRQRKHLLKQKLVLASRNNVAMVLSERNADNKPTDRALESSWKYLERKQKDEFAPHSTISAQVEETVTLDDEQEALLAERVNVWKQTPKKVRVTVEEIEK